MAYKSKFKGAEIDAHLEKMVNVSYDELVTLRNEGKLIAGQMYRMTDYETACTLENTQVAGHPFDLVLTALDNKTLDEKCSAIWSERDTDGYFANSNLPAWDVRYCLDNDTYRFAWAQMKGKFLIAYDEWEEYEAVQDGTIEIDGVTYIKWSATNGWAILCTKTASPQYGEEVIVMEIGYEDEPWTAFVNGIEERVGGKGVIYRLIDESENSVPYDFKNIMFMRPLTEGVLDGENGIETFCYTFSCIQVDLTIEDQSVKEPHNCYNNKFASYCSDNVFLTFSESTCSANTFGDNCGYNTFGDNCCYNSFGNNCYTNTFGDNCYTNTFGNYYENNIFGHDCYENTFGNYCYKNTINNSCYQNIFGNQCRQNTIGITCWKNTFGNYCRSNYLGNGCYENIFGNGCYGCGFVLSGNFKPSQNALDDCHHNCYEDGLQSILLWVSQYAEVKNIAYTKVTAGVGVNNVGGQGVLVDTGTNFPQTVVQLKSGFTHVFYYDDIINA